MAQMLRPGARALAQGTHGSFEQLPTSRPERATVTPLYSFWIYINDKKIVWNIWIEIYSRGHA
jgi:hypothetical protein